MFRWADGGNLREFWQNNKKPKLSASLVRDVVIQLRWLADALNKLHDYRVGSYRHGDVKPENILRVRTKSPDDPEVDVGVLKIADMGLAKHHTVATEFRPPTSMRYTTYRYEPPEVIIGASLNHGRSRRYDIWSIGCVTLELIIWLLYGTDVLNDFNKDIVGEMGEPSPYFEIEKMDNKKIAKVHPAVDAAMDALRKDQECRRENTAMLDLLHIVQTKLLVVNLGPATIGDGETTASPPDKTKIQVGYRASAWMFRDALDEIIGKGEKNERYWYTGKNRDHIQRLQTVRPQGPDVHLTPDYKPGSGQGIPTRQKESMPPPSGVVTLVVPTLTQAPKVCN
jgi:serine/threonine protein kinase